MRVTMVSVFLQSHGAVALCEVEQLPLGLAQDLYVTVPRGQRSTLKSALQYSEDILAPVAAGQQLGTLRVTLADELIAERPVVALISVAEGGLLQRARDTVLRYFQ